MGLCLHRRYVLKDATVEMLRFDVFLVAFKNFVGELLFSSRFQQLWAVVYALTDN